MVGSLDWMGWFVGWLACLNVVRFVSWLAGLIAGWLDGLLVFRLVGWLIGCCPDGAISPNEVSIPSKVQT